MTVAEMWAALGAGPEVPDLEVVDRYAALHGDPATFQAQAIAPPPSPFDPEADALASLQAAFADVEPIVFRMDGADLPPFPAIKSNMEAKDRDGTGSGSLRRIVWEIGHANLPRRPRKTDSLAHRGQRWAVIEIEDRDDVDAWEVTVTNAGPA